MAARVIQPRLPTPARRRRDRRWPVNARVHVSRPTAVRAGAVAAGFVVIAGAVLGIRSIGNPPRPQYANARLSARAASPSNLLANGSFEDSSGAAPRVQGWGAATLDLVSSPVASGDRAQHVLVAPGQSGGFYIEAPVNAGTTYDQSLMLRVDALASAARVEIGLEWYDDAHHLLGYRMVPVDKAEQRYTEQEQQLVAPAGATSVRFLVNATGGASYLVDDAAIEVAPPPTTVPQPPR